MDNDGDGESRPEPEGIQSEKWLLLVLVARQCFCCCQYVSILRIRLCSRLKILGI